MTAKQYCRLEGDEFPASEFLIATVRVHVKPTSANAVISTSGHTVDGHRVAFSAVREDGKWRLKPGTSVEFLDPETTEFEKPFNVPHPDL